jgi:L-lactate dehydrogenase
MKVGIIGLGKVGSTIAYTLLFMPRIREILVMDISRKRLDAEVADLNHASCILHGRAVVREASYEEMRKLDAIVIAAGFARTEIWGIFMTDAEMYERNKPVVKSIMRKLGRKRGRTVYLVTNPSVMLAADFKIIPTGVILDKVRKRTDKVDGLQILSGKGYTNWGITAEVVARICLGRG